MKNKEGFSRDKFNSCVELLIGTRAKDFDAFLRRAPSEEELRIITEQLKKPEIENVIFDLDGTLAPPYGEVSDETMALLRTYREAAKKVMIFTHSKRSPRIDKLENAGVLIAQTQACKPSLGAFREICEKHGFDPDQTAMIGNFAVTDMPLVERNSEPFFPLNILVQSIPPEKGIKKRTEYVRAKVFHIINSAAAELVKVKNPRVKRVTSEIERKR